jgi:hypothetical protein
VATQHGTVGVVMSSDDEAVPRVNVQVVGDGRALRIGLDDAATLWFHGSNAQVAEVAKALLFAADKAAPKFSLAEVPT